MSDEILKIGKHEFKSRLIVGTGKYRNFEEMREALDASGTDCVTVAVRMMDLDADGKGILDYIDTDKFKILPNTAGCYNADDAIRHCELARETGVSDMVKLEVLGDKQTLLPDPIDTLKAAEYLVKEGFTVLVYTSDDPIIARKLEDLGVAAVMPAGAPIGSGQGILNPNAIRIILEQITSVPVIVDAGVGTASDVTQAFELGVDGVLLNTGIALAKKPIVMAKAMKAAAEAGRHAFLAGRIPKKLYATASSPTEGIIK